MRFPACFVAIFERELGDAGFVEVAEAFGDHALKFFVARQPHNPNSAMAQHLNQRVTAKYRLSAGRAQRRLERAAWAASLGRADWDFRPALWTNSAYRRHLGSRSRAPLLYCAKFYQKLRRATVLIEWSLLYLRAPPRLS